MKQIFTCLLSLCSLAMSAQSVTVHLTQAGTLGSHLSEEQKRTTENLTITGPINSADIQTIRDMSFIPLSSDSGIKPTKGRLSFLNLKEATIVSGGGFYLCPNSDAITTKYTTKDNELSSHMFNECQTIKKIILPDNITSIDSLALCATSISSIVIPEKVKSLGVSALGHCEQLKDIHLNQNLDSIGLLCFYGDSSLVNITIPPSVKTMGDGCFYWCVDLQKVNLPDQLTRLGEDFFEYCGKLESVKLPSNLKEIAPDAFYKCSNLKTLVLPKSLEKIGEGAFKGCLHLQPFEIPEKVSYIGPASFVGAWEVNGIRVNPKNPYFTTIDGSLVSKDSLIFYQYYNNNDPITYVVPPSVMEIAPKAISLNGTIENLFLPPNLQIIDNSGIDEMYYLKNIYSTTKEPAGCTDESFDSYLYDLVTIFVPIGTLDAYKAAKGWKNFKSIKENAICGICSPETHVKPVNYYDCSGRKHEHPVKGVNIIQYSNGQTKRIYIP